MENCVAEPEDPSLSAADSGTHRHRLPPFAVCLVSGSILLPGCLTVATLFTCGGPFLVWLVCLFFWPRALPT